MKAIVFISTVLAVFSSMAHESSCQNPHEAQSIVERFIHGRLDKIHDGKVNPDRVYWSSEFGLKYMNECEHTIGSHYLVFKGGEYSKYQFHSVLTVELVTHKWTLRSLEVRNSEGKVIFDERN